VDLFGDLLCLRSQSSDVVDQPLAGTNVAQKIRSRGLRFRNSRTYTVCDYISRIFHLEIISVFIAEGQPWRRQI